jgi:hypothetical protein
MSNERYEVLSSHAVKGITKPGRDMEGFYHTPYYTKEETAIHAQECILKLKPKAFTFLQKIPDINTANWSIPGL